MSKMKDKKIKNLYYTLSANVLTFLMGIVTGFIIPKFLGIEDFAYIKLFTFYITYVGISHFGFLDGIYIKYGACDYKDLPKEKFRGYFRYLVLLQIVESLVLSVGVYIIIKDNNRSMIMYMVIFNMIITNITTLFAFIHQFTKRFKLFSLNLVLNKLIYVVGSLVFIYFNMLGYMPFVIIQTLINVLILGIYMYYNKELVFGKCENIFENFNHYKKLTKSGFFIMIGNFMGVVILGIDRLFVDKFFGLEDFAMYSFAYTLISLFFILLNSITTVIYPYLARINKNTYKKVYESIRISLTAIMGITLVGYFFIKAIVINFLPKYENSLSILIFLVPTVLYSAQINILIANYYKVLNFTKDYTKNNIIALILGIITNIIALTIFNNPTSIAIATLISFILWLWYSDNYFKKVIGIRYGKGLVLDLIIVAAFICTAIISNWFIGAIIYFSLISILLFIGYRNDFKSLLEVLKDKE